MLPINQCAFTAQYMLGTVAEAENIAINETEKILFLYGTFIRVRVSQ